MASRAVERRSGRALRIAAVAAGLLIVGGCSGGDEDARPTECGMLAVTSVDGSVDPEAVVPLATSVDFHIDEQLPGLPDRLSTGKTSPSCSRCGLPTTPTRWCR